MPVAAKKGWRVIDNPPVRFRRASEMKPMPIPVCGGSVETLRSFLNVQLDADFVLIVAWALACLRKRGPYRYRALGRTGFTQPAGANLVVRPLRFPSKRNVLGTQREPTKFAFH